jgi:hypothetical protein
MSSLAQDQKHKMQNNENQLVVEKGTDSLVNQNENDRPEYYRRKYEFLREHGFFENIDNEQIMAQQK